MKIQVFLGMNFMILLLSLFQSCCTNKYEWQVTSIYEMRINELDSSTPVNDTINGEFHLITSFNEELVKNQKSINLINTAYATQCHEKWINSILADSFKLKLDKEFIYKGDTIPINEDILSIPEIRSVFVSGYDIHFTSDFFLNSIFHKGEYVFKLIGKTSDNIVLKGEKKIYIDI